MSVVPLPDVEGGGPAPPPRSHRSRRRVMFALVLTILLALFVPPYVNLKRFRSTLEGSLGRALDRRVTIGAANLRLLPRPGFDFSDFKVYDDPSISNEPMLRADSVTASLRLTSLWRGRLEIASLGLRDLSLNVVRATDGRWNVESLLARASQVPTAPTTLTRAEQRPRFPYIEAEGGRINFKLGQEKKAFTLVDAEFSLWLAQEDEWNLRLNARPVRTDFNLSDTGRLRLSGTVRRAGSFRETPLNLRLTLERAQLGQLTTLVYDRDRGWRGTTNATAVLAGTPARLQLVLDAAVDDFRRYDIMTGGAFSLRARCTGNYSVDSGVLSGILCTLPAGDGQFALRGEISHPFADRQFDIGIAAKDIAVQELVRFAQHAKRDLPLDLAADGEVDAAFTFQTRPEDRKRLQSWAGGGSIHDLVLRSRTLGPALELGTIRFSVEPAGNERARRGPPVERPPLQLVVAPFAVDLGARTPVNVRGIVTRAEYALAVEGDADLTRVLNVAQGLGIPAPQRSVTGAAHLALQIQGAWAGFGSPLTIGNVQLKNVALTLPAADAPLHVASALVSLAPDQSSINLVSAAFEGVRGTLDGSVQLPRRCDFGPQCVVRFDLRADEFATDQLNRLLNPALRKRAWYQFAGGGSPSGLRSLHAEGHIAAGKLQIKSLVANRASADVKLSAGRLELSNARADILGGKHQGRWQADFTGNTPAYSGAGTLDGASMALVSTLMHDNWAAGTAQVSYKVNLAGWNAIDLVDSLAAKLDFQWRDGILRHVVLRGAEPLRFSRFHGHAELDDGKFTFGASSMESPSGIYRLEGTASLGRELDVKLTPASGPEIVIGGTLQKPRLTAAPSPSRVALKQ